MAKQALGYTPPEQRNFFLQGAAREPLALYSHDYHWIELARMKHEPNASPIRRLANRAARGLASLYVQSNELTLQQAGHFHAQWTPRGWSDPNSDLVAFEQQAPSRLR
jgi:hypothetical protein